MLESGILGVGEDVEKENSQTAGEKANSAATVTNNKGSQKIKLEGPHETAGPLLGVRPRFENR